MREERTVEKGQNGTEVSLYHPEILFHCRRIGAFSKVQELLPTPWKLLELRVALPQRVLCKVILTLIVLLTLAAH